MKKIRFTSFLLIFLIFNQAGADSNNGYEVESVEFEGNHAYSDGDLHKVMVTRPSSFFNHVTYHEDVLKEDLKNLELFYRNRGYLEAKVTGHQVQKDTSEQKVHIKIQIEENQLTHVEGISYFGNETFGDSVLQDLVAFSQGDPYNQNKLNNSTAKIMRKYADNGYLDAEVNPDVRIDRENHLALIDFVITEGVQYTIDEIRVKGLDKTKPYVVRRELELEPGDVVNYSRLLEAQREIYMTGLFQSVYVRPDTAQSGETGKKDIVIEVKESIPGEFNVAVGYGSIEKLRGTVEVYTTNLRGTARKVGLQTRASFVERRLQGSFTEPWTFGVPWRTDLNLRWEYRDEPGYDLRRVGGELAVGREFLKRSSATVSYRIERVNLSNVQTTEIPDNLKNDVRALKLSLVYDTRNDLFNSTRGTYIELSNEVSGAILKSTISFYRVNLIVKKFFRVRRTTVIGTAMEIGWMAAGGGLAEIPLNERYYAGGPSSVRGLEYQKAGPLDANRVPLGGTLKGVWNIFEIRQTIYKMFGGVLFTDLGNVWSEAKHLNPKDLRPSVGIGLRVNTPIGLARLDYGVNLNRHPGDPPGQLYLSMGQAF